MAYSINWKKFKDESLRAGYHESEIGTLPGAREAVEADKAAEWKALTTKTDWSQTSTGKDYFQNDDEYREAMRDPLYKVNPHYREAVHRMLSKSDESIGQSHQPEAPDMLGNMRRDAARANFSKLAKMAAQDPAKREELIQFLASEDPEIQSWVAEGFASVDTRGPLDKASAEAGVQRIGPDLSISTASDEGTNNGEGEGK